MEPFESYQLKPAHMRVIIVAHDDLKLEACNATREIYLLRSVTHRAANYELLTCPQYVVGYLFI